ncbi:hypothetical protein GCM10027570_24260 [Streptomonospora sediminis]
MRKGRRDATAACCCGRARPSGIWRGCWIGTRNAPGTCAAGAGILSGRPGPPERGPAPVSPLRSHARLPAGCAASAAFAAAPTFRTEETAVDKVPSAPADDPVSVYPVAGTGGT